ncbi:hypothetical protein ACFE04_007861 [Oxalis oulophora]
MYFWFDPWLDGKSVVDIVSEDDIKVSGFRRNALVADCLQNNGWNLPSDINNSIEAIWTLGRDVDIDISRSDLVEWSGNVNGKYSIRSGSELLRKIMPYIENWK